MPSVTATIEAAGSLSDAVDLHTGVVAGTGNAPVATAVVLPEEWETQALTFQVSVDGVTYADLRRVGSDGVHAEYKITAAVAEEAYPLNSDDFKGFRYLKVRSGTSAAPANQTEECAIVIGTVDY